MGPWSSGKKPTNGNDDTGRQGGPRPGPARPPRGPTGTSRSNARPQDGMNREYEDRGPQARQVAPRAGGEGQPQGRAVARSHGRPVQKRPTAAAGAPEGSTSQHVLQGPRQTGALPPAPASVRHHGSHNERVRAQATSNDPRTATADTMRSRRDNSPVKNTHNVRPMQSTVPAMGNYTRSVGRGGGIQPGPVSARGGVPRPSRPPAPNRHHHVSVLGKTSVGPSQEHRSSAPHRDQQQPVTSASTNRNALPLDDGGARSGQQIVINPRHKGQNRSSNQSQSQTQNNHMASASSSKASNTSRTNNAATNDQSRLPNNQSSRTDASSVLGTSRQIVQKTGNNNNQARNTNTEHRSGQRTNSMFTGSDLSRLSSSSSDGDNIEGATNNTKNKQERRATKRDSGKPENANTRTMASEGANRGNTDRNAASASSSRGNNSRNVVLSSDDPARNADNPNSQQVQRTGDNTRNNRPPQSGQVLKQKPTQQVRAQQQRPGQSSVSDRTDNIMSTDRSNATTVPTAEVRNSRANNTSADSTVGMSGNGSNERSGEGQALNSPTEGPRERPGGGEQNTRGDTVSEPVVRLDNVANASADRQQRVPESNVSSGSRDVGERVQRSNNTRIEPRERSGQRNQRLSEGNEPSSQATARNSRITNRSQPTSANAQSNTTASNNTSESANNSASSQRRTEVTVANNGSRINQASSQNRTTVQSNNTRSSTTQNTSARQTTSQDNNRPGTNARTSNTRNTGQIRAVVQSNGANNSTSARVTNQNRSNMSMTVTAQVGDSRPSQQRQGQGGAVLDPSQLSVDIIENSVSISDQPPPYSTLDVHRNNNRRSRGNNRQTSPGQALPDILNSHVHPPRQNESRSTRRSAHPDGGSRRSRPQSGRRPPRGMTRLDSTSSWEGCTKWGCLRCLTIITTFRWILIFLALLGVCCVLTGIILGALHMTIGSSFLTLSLMFIGKSYF